MRIITFILLALIVALALTNPDMSAFEKHVEDEAAQLIRNEIGDESWLGNAVGSLAGSALASQAPEFTTRTNYVVASTYAIDIDENGEPDLKWIGLGNRFFQLDTSD